MALGRALSVALTGVQGDLVEIEAHIGQGLPKTMLVGLPDASLNEARDRCKAAVINTGLQWPQRLLTIAMAPANLPKKGSHFDLGIALAILDAAAQLDGERVDRTVALGELSLDGRLRAVPGVLPAVLAATRRGIRSFLVPEANVDEARLVDDVSVWGVRSLGQVVALLKGQEPPSAPPVAPLTGEPWAGLGVSKRAELLDLADVLGQPEARRTVEVAAAGRHHLLLDGPPGAGKTMLAERLPGLLPDLGREEALDVTAVHSVAGVLPPEVPLLVRPPFVDPHHSASTVSVVGGGSRRVRPGALSLAHHGVLFLDEAPEFRQDILEALRQPLESGEILIGRAEHALRFPARFQLVLAANPCPCGRRDDGTGECGCPPSAQRRYLQRLSGPIRDRLDLHRTVRPVSARALKDRLSAVESTATVAARVAAARDRQLLRYADLPWSVNASVPGPALRRDFPPDAAGSDALDQAVSAGRLTARGADRVLRVAWTVADLRGESRPGREAVAEARALRESLPLGAWVEVGGSERSGLAS